MTVLTFGNSGLDGKSSPFYDYTNDVIYAGDNSGALHQFAAHSSTNGKKARAQRSV